MVTSGLNVYPSHLLKVTLLIAVFTLGFLGEAPAIADPNPVPQPVPPPSPTATPAPAPAPPAPRPTMAQPSGPTFPADAWPHFMNLLNSRGLSIDPAEQSFDDRANRQLCITLTGNSDPAFRARFIQGSIEQSEGGTWGPAEATYAIHAAIQAYCPQFDQ